MAECENHSDGRPEQYHPEYWQGDSPEHRQTPAPDPHEVVTAVMVVAYETLHDRPILPSATLATFASDLMVYNLGRSLKEPDDAIEFFITRDDRNHVQAFLTQAFGVIEVAHKQGLSSRAIIAALETRAAALQGLERAVSDIDLAIENDRFCTRVWQTALISAEEVSMQD